MNSSSDPLGKSTGGSQPISAAHGAGTPAKPLDAAPTCAPGNGSAVDEFGLDSTPTVDTSPTLTTTIKTILVGKPRDLADTSIYHSLSLVAFLAWVGLGADGLSSSCYGPAEAFAMLTEGGDFRFLAVFLALATAGTVFVISACYSHILEAFPSGGGGYLVASKLLGPKVGVVSGCALLVDYALTITTSIAAAGDALFGLLSPDFHVGHFSHFQCKMGFESFAVVALIVLNLRGIKESVTFLLPIFIVFLITHIILITGALVLNFDKAGAVVDMVGSGLRDGVQNPEVGPLALMLLFLHAYSMGAGTYTGIEAVSNSMPVMREPRVQTGQRTMRLMAISLALTAGGLMVAYLLLNITPSPDKTMNTVLSEGFVEELGLPAWLGNGFVLVTVISEGCLLFVAAQAGFIDGPRVLANMARDSWMPHWFGNLSERLSVHNGVMLMGFSALLALWFTGGMVTTLLVMYSINVFVTFSLSMIGMCRHWWELRGEDPIWKRRFALFLFGATMCVGILIGNVIEKAEEGGWVTIVVTSTLVGISLLIHRYYGTVFDKLQRLNSLLGIVTPPGAPTAGEPQPHDPVAAVLVGGYSGLGVHTMLNALRFGPGQFKGLVFLSVGIVDSGNFKGADAVEDLRAHTEESLNKYVDHARRLGMPAIGFMSIGTDPVDELERLCVEVQKRYARAIFFAGRLVFQKDTWYQRLLHNETAYSLQRRLQWDGVPMVILPTRVR
ncbi:MAG TPA: APC family permease [Pirellulales bacterium]|jgi:amino acid transporter|nr:APC family permease [Pirellulales bacterium]